MLSDFYIRRTGSRKWGRRIFGMDRLRCGGGCVTSWPSGGKLEFPGNLWAYAIPLVLDGLLQRPDHGPGVGGRARHWRAVLRDGERGDEHVPETCSAPVSGIFVTGMILRAYTVNKGAPDEMVSESGYVVCFAMYGIVYLLGAASWLFIDASKPIVPEEE